MTSWNIMSYWFVNTLYLCWWTFTVFDPWHSFSFPLVTESLYIVNNTFQTFPVASNYLPLGHRLTQELCLSNRVSYFSKEWFFSGLDLWDNTFSLLQLSENNSLLETVESHQPGLLVKRASVSSMLRLSSDRSQQMPGVFQHIKFGSLSPLV